MYTYSIILVTISVSLLCFKNNRLMERLAFIPFRTVKKGEWYRLLTHGFVHADGIHLLVNMFTFWSFGGYIEHTFQALNFPAWAFPLLYFGGMVAASLHDLVRRRDDPYYSSIGASGAVSAVLFSAILLQPWDKILIFALLPVPGVLFGLLYLAYCHYMARRSADNINHNAHFYGALFGFLLPALIEPALFRAFINQLFAF